jgi:hypothetical protein
MKKETLEEVATKEGLYRCSQHNFNQAESGYNAKWFKRGAIFGAKWQQENSYSEEEALNLLTHFSVELQRQIKTKESPIKIKEWFNQFKK